MGAIYVPGGSGSGGGAIFVSALPDASTANRDIIYVLTTDWSQWTNRGTQTIPATPATPASLTAKDFEHSDLRDPGAVYQTYRGVVNNVDPSNPVIGNYWYDRGTGFWQFAQSGGSAVTPSTLIFLFSSGAEISGGDDDVDLWVNGGYLNSQQAANYDDAASFLSWIDPPRQLNLRNLIDYFDDGWKFFYYDEALDKVRTVTGYNEATEAIAEHGAPAWQPLAGGGGGGAIEPYPTFAMSSISTSEDDIWLDLGFDWDQSIDYMAFTRTGGNALYWFRAAEIYGSDDSVDPGTIGSAPVSAQRYTVNDAGIGGSVNLGINAAGRALIEFTSSQASGVSIIILKYIAASAQGGLTSSDRDELTRLSGVETNATKDQTGPEVKGLYEGEPDTNVYTDDEKTKLGGVASGANNIIPYKIGNIYRAFASGASVVKPGNTEGTVTATGITAAPAGWRLTRPEATSALPHVYDCHVYGYSTNGVFSWQFGTPNRTDRYIAPGGGGGGLTAAQVETLIQNALTAAVNGNTETGISVIHNSDGTLDFVVSGGGGTPPAQTHLNYVGVRAANTNVVAGDLTVSGMTAALALPAYNGTAHLIYAYPTAEGPPDAIYLYQDGHRNVQNQSSIFGVTGTVQIGGEEHTWRATDDAQTGFGTYILEQAR